jgi:hypothetical protein
MLASHRNSQLTPLQLQDGNFSGSCVLRDNLCRVLQALIQQHAEPIPPTLSKRLRLYPAHTHVTHIDRYTTRQSVRTYSRDMKPGLNTRLLIKT